MFRQEQAFIGSSEIRSIDDEYRATYVGYRDEVQRMLDDIIVAGVDRGDFTTDSRRERVGRSQRCASASPPGTRDDGELSADELIAQNLHYARAIVGS